MTTSLRAGAAAGKLSWHETILRLAFGYLAAGEFAMPIPEFDDDGLLPVGVHDCTLEEITARFGSSQKADRRHQLCDRLKRFCREVKSTHFIGTVIVGGSFVTANPAPNNIDLILVLRTGLHFAVPLRPFERNVLSRSRVRKRFGFDILLAEESEREMAAYIEFLAQVRDNPGRQKGMLRVKP
jgi:hypothetical protein